jgi:hypothetical protein
MIVAMPIVFDVTVIPMVVFPTVIISALVVKMTVVNVSIINVSIIHMTILHVTIIAPVCLFEAMIAMFVPLATVAAMFNASFSEFARPAGRGNGGPSVVRGSKKLTVAAGLALVIPLLV